MFTFNTKPCGTLWLAATFFTINVCVPIAGHSQDLTAAKVRKSIERGMRYLLSNQSDNGSWQGGNETRYPEGVTALATLALLNSGLSPRDSRMQKAIERLIEVPDTSRSTYVTSLRIMVLAIADPKLYRLELQKDVDWLVSTQISAGGATGGWGYPWSNGDASNSQFALLALHEANSVGANIPQKVWERALKYWKSSFHRPSGGFAYDVRGSRINGSMTCAGISSTIIAEENLADIKNLVRDGEIVCCNADQQSNMVNMALDWMGKRFSFRGVGAKHYFLYGMERAGRLSGERFFGAHDWYREGAEHLLKSQKSSGMWKGTGFNENDGNIATSFALLFLSKGKRPIAIGKFKFSAGNDWDRHPKGVHYLTRELESQWKTRLNWQTIDGNLATAQDLAETPVLFISGRDQLDLTDAQKQALKTYIENGNFIFAEASQGNGCGNNVAFDRKFRALMKELFPDTQLEPLSSSHPIWNSHFEIQPQRDWPILGLQACCRTSVVYCPRSLTGHWQLSRKAVLEKLPNTAKTQVQYATELGVNVVSYATGRQLRDKLDLPQINNQAVSVLTNRALVLPKLEHRGGSDDAPNAWRNVLRRASESGLTIDMEKKIIAPVEDQLFDHPFVFMHGRNNFFFKDAEIKALRSYLKGGNRGFLFADAICSSQSFITSFERQVVRIVPDGKLEPIPAEHPIWSDQFGGYNIKTVTITKPDRSHPSGFARRTVAPQFKGVELNGRLVVVFSPFDLSCALENASVSHCEGYTRQDAIKLALNILLYRLQSD